MSSIVRWWLRWTFSGLKLLVLLAAAGAAVAATYFGATAIELTVSTSIDAAGKGLDPKLKQVYSIGWRIIVHSVQLALFTFVFVGAFPEFFEKELAAMKARSDADLNVDATK